jgi:EpsI family protein
MICRIAILSTLLLAACGYLLFAARPEIKPISEPLANLPVQLGTWQGYSSSNLDNSVLAVLGVDEYINRLYYSPNQTVIGLYVGYYQSQREGDTIHSPLNCLPGSGWNPMERHIVSIQIGSGTSIRINSLVVTKGTDKQVVLYWYQSHGRVIASEYMGKIFTVLDALRTNRTDAALVRVISPIMGMDTASEVLAEEQAIDFVKNLFPTLSRFLQV